MSEQNQERESAPTVSKPNPNAQRALLDKFMRAKFAQGVNQETAIQSRPTKDSAPLSFNQKQIWLHAQMVSDIPLYNEAITIYRQGPLDFLVLRRCLLEIVRRHEIWRTTFHVVADEPVQIAHAAPQEFPLQVVDLRDLPECKREKEARRLAGADVRRRFDLSTGPLLRAFLITLDDHEHRLYMTFHHLVFDAVTAYQVFVPELETLYDAFSSGKRSPLAEPRMQYADFASWQRERACSQIWAADLAYWREKLGQELPVCPWPNDHSRPVIESHKGAVERFAFPEELSRKIRMFSREAGVSVYMMLFAGLAAVLHRYTNEDEFVLGSLTSGRTRTEVERVAGYFVNPLAIRLNASGNPSFRELLKRTRVAILEGMAHERAPFLQVVKEVQPKHDPSRNPLFQIILSQQPAVKHVAPGWEVVSEEISNGGSKLDLLIVIDDRGGAISGPMTYNPDLFDPETIQRLVGHWNTLLEGAIANPERALSDLSILTAEEQTRVLIDWNRTETEYPNGNQCLHRLIEEQAERTPQATGLIFEGHYLAYGELNERANQVAWYLRKLGVGPDVLVGVLAERSLEMVVALLGVLKAGGAYVPIDPDYPADRVAFMLEDAGAPVLLTQARFAARLPQHKGITICLDSEWNQILDEETANPPSITTPESLAYMIYTSGSTGKPKGAMNTHRGICNRLLWMQDQYGLTEADTILQKTPFSFDVSVWEFFWPLLVGARLVLARPGGHREPAYLVDLIREQQVTVLHFVPLMLGIFLDQPGVEHSLSLRHVICSGEALPFHLQEQFFKLLPAQLHNLYGPTEAAVDVTHWTCQRDSERKFVPIGRPVANTQIYVLDGNMQPVPIGVPGELYIGGVQVGRGYHNRPELTAERFLPDQFSGKPEARIYKTGDLCRWLEDGAIEYLGRMDFQVKVRGQRIELGEIEAVLSTHEAVKQCVVVARESEGDRALVAYFEPRAESTVEIASLREHLKKQLPDYMVPAAFVRLNAIPLTPNGKVNRNDLPAPGNEQVDIKDQYAAPQNPIEHMLVHLWAKVLRVKRVGVRDNFFELGGHSLLALRLLGEIEKVYGKRLPLATFLQTPTIRQLSDILRKQEWEPSWRSLVPVRPGGSKPPLFLMHSHGGNVLEYFPVADHLDEEQPVYALQAQGLDGRIVTGRSVQEMVTAYLAEIKSLQPEGPYFLGGYCSGGVLAWEAAQQLRAQGERVALLVLIQTFHPSCVQFKPTTTVFHRWWYRMKKRIDLERENLSIHGKRHITERCQRALDIVRTKAVIGFDNLIGHSRRSLSVPYILERLAIEHNGARDKYLPSSYPGDVLLFRSIEQLSGLVADFSLGWRDLIRGELEICEVRGHQENMLSEPNVTYIAGVLNSRLERAQEYFLEKSGCATRDEKEVLTR
ncbi:MAG: amino acid adenylation domain-containing protein [Candidatus Sulfotelmatobacter sp.]